MKIAAVLLSAFVAIACSDSSDSPLSPSSVEAPLVQMSGAPGGVTPPASVGIDRDGNDQVATAKEAEIQIIADYQKYIDYLDYLDELVDGGVITSAHAECSSIFARKDYQANGQLDRSVRYECHYASPDTN